MATVALNILLLESLLKKSVDVGTATGKKLTLSKMTQATMDCSEVTFGKPTEAGRYKTCRWREATCGAGTGSARRAYGN